MKDDVRRVPVARLANGGEIALVLHDVVGGLGDGPTVGICAAIHGNEPTGTKIVIDVARQLADLDFRGRLLLLPVANPPAFQANSRHTPIDDLNLNRVFPGNPDGWFTEQLAHTITDQFLNEIDVLIDLHSGGDSPTVDYVYMWNDEELSRCFGSRVLYRASGDEPGTMFAGTSATVAIDRGIPCVTVELGGGLVDQAPYVERGVRGVCNMLKKLDVLDSSPDAPPEQIVVDGIETVRPHCGGLLETVAPALGDAIEQGDVLGRILDPYTFQVLKEIKNPVAHGVMILSHLSRNVVQPGDYGYMVGSPE